MLLGYLLYFFVAIALETIYLPQMYSQFCRLLTLFYFVADFGLEESQLDLPFLPSPEAHTTILLLHALLHHPPDDDVCA